MGPHNSPGAALLQEVIEERRGRPKDFFVYSALWNPLAASDSEAQDIQIQSDSDFLIVAATGVSRDTGTFAAVADRPFTLVIFDAGSGRNLFDRAQDFDAVIGTAQRAAWWTVPKLVGRSSTLSLTLGNLTATARRVQISLWGVKLFNSPMGT